MRRLEIASGPPRDEAELMERAGRLAGRPLSWLAEVLERPVPDGLHRAKGWVGQLVEAALGGPQTSAAGPDFAALGVELKTLPVSPRGIPRESTFICTAPLEALGALSWPDSPVRWKLARVLWVPVQADPDIPVGDRRVGSPLLWSPTPDEDAALASDWDELSELVALGYVESITAHRGRYLQIRPKAQNAKQETWAPDDDGDRIRTLPRGFYLRRRFTEGLIARNFRC